ncbi:flagellar protein FlaG [Pseudomonas putida]|uniref:flagellar protein FlaG n=1 Tax=Pseudomonas putida TaxID=303 RepID=UPI000A543FAD|nr:flagellar protein FlaG [Pseudomonas putida]MCE0958960.1 flagellar protein FlaG [Pseudomonas putida]MCE0971045.1 flagellar protein FlaG [Pseudomonas putida]MDD2117584.1 flagellar protein FlaG [Pseudomonas putida]UPU91062.1 flagellar protein FlaG [Pseudomonas putida]HDS1728452.1 flagellar protein FlaG [Pseudomonas putida]
MDMSVKLGLSNPASAALDAPTSKRQATEKAANEPGEKGSQPVSRPDLESAVNSIQDFIKASDRQLDFSIDDSTGEVVVKVIARQSGEVIRQLPSEVALKLAENLKDANSLLFDTQA